MAASIEAAAGGAGASGSADLSHKLNDAAKRLGIKAGATTPLVLRTTDKPWKGAVGGLWAFDVRIFTYFWALTRGLNSMLYFAALLQ